MLIRGWDCLSILIVKDKENNKYNGIQVINAHGVEMPEMVRCIGLLSFILH